MPQGAGFSGDRGGQIKRGPRRSLRRGKEPCSSRKPSSFWTKDERRKTKDERRRSGDKGAAGEARFFRRNAHDQVRGLLSARPAGLASAPANAAAAALAAPAAAAAGASALFHRAQGQHGPKGQKAQEHHRSHALKAGWPAGTRRRHRARPRRTAAGRRLPPSSRNPAPAAPPQWPRCRAYRAA